MNGTAEDRQTLGAAVRALAGRCDWAQRRDGQGFNASDTGLGHRLAEVPEEEWSAAMRRAAWEMLAKYSGQLAEYGIEYEELPEPPAPEANGDARGAAKREVRHREAQADATARWNGDGWTVSFPYDPELVAAVKDKVPGRRFDGGTKEWHAPDTELAAAGVLRLADEDGVALSDDDRARAENRAGVVEELGDRFVRLAGDRFEVVFPFDRRAKDDLKQRVPAARWDDTVWTVPVDAPGGLAAFADARGFTVTEEAAEVLREASARTDELREASEAESAEPLDVEERLGGELYPFQRAGVRYATRTSRCMIADEMGLGKTVQALAVLEAREAFPAVVVVPASLKRNWQREARRWLPAGRTVQLVEGTTAGPTSADVVIANYAIVGHRVSAVTDETTGESEERFPWVEALRAREPRAVVLDESHYVKNGRSNRSRAVAELVRDVPVRLLLTGTPVLNRPAELIHQLKVMGRFRELAGNWKRFVTRYCNAYRGRFGWDTSGASNLEELNAKLRASCYVRRRKEDVLKDLPAKQRATVPVELSNRPEYEEARRDLIEWLREQKGKSAAERASRAEQLARVSHLKQLAARGKMADVVAWVRDFIDSGEKLVLFAHHREVQARLYEEFTDVAVRIAGGDDGDARQQAVDRFQQDDAVRLMVGSLKAAGVGITLTAASHVAFAELGWTPADHDQAEDRVHRIGQEDSVNAWYLLAEGTIDEEIHALIEAKRDVVTKATEGGEPGAQGSVLAELVDTMTAEEG